MCAIVDNNVVNEVFGGDPPEAGKQFRRWLGSRNGRLVVGGRLLEELTRDRKDFRPAHKKLLGMRNLCRAPGHG